VTEVEERGLEIEEETDRWGRRIIGRGGKKRGEGKMGHWGDLGRERKMGRRWEGGELGLGPKRER
jgi:hypothetical protein